MSFLQEKRKKLYKLSKKKKWIALFFNVCSEINKMIRHIWFKINIHMSNLYSIMHYVALLPDTNTLSFCSIRFQILPVTFSSYQKYVSSYLTVLPLSFTSFYNPSNFGKFLVHELITTTQISTAKQKNCRLHGGPRLVEIS